VIAPGPKLVGLLALLVLLAVGSFWMVRQAVHLAPGADGLALGMAWLQKEYQLDDEVFNQVTQAHQRYFRECRQRCNELDEIQQHFLSEIRQEQTDDSGSDLDAVQMLQESVCHECRLAMIHHIHEVAALMPENTGRRFIADVQQALQPSTRRPRLTPR